MESLGDLCFPLHNSSCRRQPRPKWEVVLLYTLLSCTCLLTMTLNLLVIISISHFRKLHTPTNAILLSLAVSDLLVGLLVMPNQGMYHIEACWLLGKWSCAVLPYIFFTLISTSVGNMVLISADRYMAICQPLIYPSKVTLQRVTSCVALCWVSSLLYNGFLLMEHLTNPDRTATCYGECVVVIDYISGMVDLLVTVVGPCSVIVVLYARVFVVAVSQARLINSHVAFRADTVTVTAKKSEWKAARTLGIVIVIFLICFCPYYHPFLEGQAMTINASTFAVVSGFIQINSCLNPLIYALFYPWFRKSSRLILTLNILRPESREANIQ